ncbi:MAG: hypothetical protein IPK83_20655 [Planctomycetes bacterium]|nr:hypothetical protein [Planctomycetota bacterium]
MSHDSTNRASIIFAFLVLAALALRLSTVGSKPIWEDEAWTFVTAVAPEGLLAISGNDLHPLSFYAFYRMLPSWFFESDFNFRIPSMLFSCVSVLLAARFFKLAISDRSLQMGSIALFALLPLNVRYSYEARAYALAEMMSLAVLTTYLSFRQRPSRGRLVALGGAVALSCHLDGFGLAAPFAVFLHAMIHYKTEPAVRRAFWTVIVGGLLASPYYLFRVSLFAAAPEVHTVGEPASLITSFAGRLVELSPVGIGFDQVSRNHRWAIFILAVLVLIVLVASAKSARSCWRSDSRRLLAILLMATPAIYAIISVVFGVSIIHKKYLIVTVPAFVPLFAAGFTHLVRNRRLPLILMLAVLPAAVSVHLIATPGSRADWRTLHEKLKSEIRPGDRFVQELQENYELYSFGSLRAYAWRSGDMISASRMLEYRPAITSHDAVIKIENASAWTDLASQSAMEDFIRTSPDGRVWALSTEWMARGRTLDLSAIADRQMSVTADGVLATLWRRRVITRGG